MKYPIGIQSFEKIMEGGFAYVDKTALVYKLVQEGTIYFLSRPRRFGKSLLVSTLENYFLGRKELFKGLAMEELEKDWLEYPVFHLDFNGTNFNEAYELDKTLETFVSTAENRYGKSPFAHTLGDRLADVFEQAYVQTGRHRWWKGKSRRWRTTTAMCSKPSTAYSRNQTSTCGLSC